MTSLKRRLDNVLTELAIIREGLEKPSRFPLCCLTFQKDGKISCDAIGPLSEEEFFKECVKCQARIRSVVSHVNLDKVQN